MGGLEIAVSATAGLNIVILGTVLLNTHRIGKLEGSFRNHSNNGGFLKCPFYKGRVDKAVEQAKETRQHGKNTER